MFPVVKRTTSRLQNHLRRWITSRQGIDPRELKLDSGRIYILPTRAGIIFAAIIFTMLVGAMNYNNNMGFALVFLLTGIAIVSIHHCHGNLKGLQIIALGAEPVFVGGSWQFRFALRDPARRARWQVAVSWDRGKPQFAELSALGETTVKLSHAACARGLAAAPRMLISTRYPLGLLRAWAWINMDLSGLAYPRPATSSTGEASGDYGQRDQGRAATGDDDFSGLRPWRPGDPTRRIAWKALARSGEKLISEYKAGLPAPRWIDWHSETAPDLEQQLSQLVHRVLSADAEGWEFGLRLPTQTVPPGRGPRHRHECLKALALMDGTSAA